MPTTTPIPDLFLIERMRLRRCINQTIDAGPPVYLIEPPSSHAQPGTVDAIRERTRVFAARLRKGVFQVKTARRGWVTVERCDELRTADYQFGTKVDDERPKLTWPDQYCSECGTQHSNADNNLCGACDWKAAHSRNAQPATE